MQQIPEQNNSVERRRGKHPALEKVPSLASPVCPEAQHVRLTWEDAWYSVFCTRLRGVYTCRFAAEEPAWQRRGVLGGAGLAERCQRGAPEGPSRRRHIRLHAAALAWRARLAPRAAQPPGEAGPFLLPDVTLLFFACDAAKQRWPAAPMLPHEQHSPLEKHVALRHLHAN